MQENLILQFTIFTLIAVGFLVRKLGLVSLQGQKSLTNLVIYVILPCNILHAFQFADMEMVRRNGLWVLGISLAIQVVCLFYGRLVFRKGTEAQRKSLRFATFCSNAGFLGNPVAEGLYGADGLSLANIYLIPLRVMMWAAGLSIYSGTHDWKATTKRVLTHPCILAILLGVGLMLLKIQLPALLLRPINALSSCNTACSMLVIGMILSGIHPRELLDPGILLFSLHRLVIIPALVYLACRLLPVGGTVTGVSVLLAAMPAGATTTMLSAKYGRDPEFATQLVIFTTLCSIPAIFLWSLLLTR